MRMEIKVIKGTHQIGGCITSISTSTTKIIIDFGEDLDEEKRASLDKKALMNEIDGAKAVFITHSHGDHVGLVNLIPQNIEVYMEEMTKRIVEVSADFNIHEPITRSVETFTLSKDKKTDSIRIGDITVTPYIVDHSSYNSCMFLIEAEEKRILHTGDYRNHGRKGSLFEPTLKSIGHIDCLITEGTTLSRSDKKKYKSEYILEREAKELIAKYDQVFVLTSSTNLDRIVSFYKARGNKKVVFDTFTAAITKAIEFKIDENSKDIYRWNPIKYDKIKLEEFKKKYMTNEYDYGFLPNYIMFIKPSMLIDMRKFKKEKFFDNACLIYSMWHGYLERDEKMDYVVDEIKKMGVDFYELHTSGHASIKAMKKMYDLLTPDKTIIIHTEAGESGDEIFPTAVHLEDNQSLQI